MEPQLVLFPPLPCFRISVFVHLLICLLHFLSPRFSGIQFCPQLVNCAIIIHAALLNWSRIIPFMRTETGLPLKPIQVTPSFPRSPVISYCTSAVPILPVISLVPTFPGGRPARPAHLFLLWVLLPVEQGPVCENPLTTQLDMGLEGVNLTRWK